jgi:Ser/Thr protein kinase RdoA (MazF antagonist)
MDLTPWGSPPIGERLGGGHRNEVYRVGDDWVARRSRRSTASLEWELDLLDHLSHNGFVVAEVVPARDGHRHVDGVVVQRWLPGDEPTADDWPLVTAEPDACTPSWPAGHHDRTSPAPVSY